MRRKYWYAWHSPPYTTALHFNDATKVRGDSDAPILLAAFYDCRRIWVFTFTKCGDLPGLSLGVRSPHAKVPNSSFDPADARAAGRSASLQYPVTPQGPARSPTCIAHRCKSHHCYSIGFGRTG